MPRAAFPGDVGTMRLRNGGVAFAAALIGGGVPVCGSGTTPKVRAMERAKFAALTK